MIVGINDALKAIAYALLVLFFVIGVMKTCGSFTELKRPEVETHVPVYPAGKKKLPDRE